MQLLSEDKIIITHGTHTMTVTVAVLTEKVSGKTIVLTVALIPYTFGSSDGFFNLGCALILRRRYRRVFMWR